MVGRTYTRRRRARDIRRDAERAERMQRAREEQPRAITAGSGWLEGDRRFPFFGIAFCFGLHGPAWIVGAWLPVG